MKRTIEQLWFGNLTPKDSFGKNNPEIKRLERLMSERLVGIQEALNEKHKDLYNEFYENLYDYMLEAVKESFLEGYCLGSKITAEALLGAEQFFEEDNLQI